MSAAMQNNTQNDGFFVVQECTDPVRYFEGIQMQNMAMGHTHIQT